jgi:hypothetical protein
MSSWSQTFYDIFDNSLSSNHIAKSTIELKDSIT